MPSERVARRKRNALMKSCVRDGERAEAVGEQVEDLVRLSEKVERMREMVVGGFNDVEEAVSVSAATSEAKQEASVMMLFQVLSCERRGDETAGAMVVGQNIALACLEASPTGSQGGRPKDDHSW